MGDSAPDFSDVDQFVQGQKGDSFGDIDDFVAQQAKGAPAPPSVAPAPAAAPVTLNTKRGGSTGVLPPAPKEPTWHDYLGSAVAAVTGSEPGAETGLTDFKSQSVSQGAKELGTPGKRVTGGLRLASEGLEAATPLMGPALIENPVSVIKGLAEGTVASKGAGYVAKKAGADEEQKSLIEDLAFWAPGVAHSFAASLGLAEPKVGVQTGPEGTGVGIAGSGGTKGGVAVTPEEIRLSGQFKGGPQRSVSIPRGGKAAGPAIEPQTIEGQIVPPPPNPVSDAASSMVAQSNAEAQAARTVAGIPPPAPPAPPTPPPIHQVTPEEVSKLAQMITQLPPELRAPAMIETHGTVAKLLAQQGKVIGPDGKLEIIDSPKAADSVAKNWLNAEVQRQDKLAEEAAKTPKAAEKSPASTKTPAKTAGPVDNEITAAKGLPKADFSDIDKFVAKAVKSQGENKPSTSASDQPEGMAEGVRKSPVSSGQSAGPREVSAGAVESSGPKTTASMSRDNGAQHRGEHQAEPAAGSVVSEPVPGPKTGREAFTKGDRVELQDGTKAEVIFTHPSQSIVRVKTDDGKKIAVGISKVRAIGAPTGNARSESGQALESVVPASKGMPDRRPAGESGKELVVPSGSVGGGVAKNEVRGRDAGEQGDTRQIQQTSDEIPEAPKYKHGSTQANIPDDSEAAKGLETARQRISKEDLAGKGSDVGGNHLTVRYGIKGEDHEGIKKYLSSLEPFEASLGKTEKFPASEHSDGAAVIHAPIEAPELHTINKEIEKHGEFTEPSFNEYKPHATVAYVKPEKADRYVGMSATEGKKFKVNSIAITDRNGKQEEIKLEGKRQEPAGATISKSSEAQPTPRQETAVQPIGAKEPSPVEKRLHGLRVQSVPGGYGVIDKDGKILDRAKTREKADGLLADRVHGPLVIKTIHGRTETLPKSPVDAGGTIEPGKPSEPPSTNNAGEGRRKISAADGHGGTELAGEQSGTGLEPGKERQASADTGERGGVDDNQPATVGTGGPGAGPSERTGLRKPAAPKSERRVARNTEWFTHPEDFSVDATHSTRLEWNTKVLTILKNVLEKGEKLTDEDRDALAHYVGWGALDKAFNPGYGSDSDMWHRASRKLQELMTPEELAAARRSTQNAHYTSPQIVRFIWSALSRMGFKGGVVLEPSMGTGNFLGMMPKGIRGETQAIGNELDPTTYNIAKLLYPSATNFNKDFVDLMLPNDSVDLAVSNVPFGVQVFDPAYRKLGKPAIHDYFFIKSLDKVRPGGVVAFITSTYTLDKQSSSVRDILADKADLLYAVRFPQDTFDKSSGTAVSSDLIVLRKRAAGVEPAGEPFGGLRDVQAKYEPYFYDKAGQTATKQINEYYAANPQNVLGELVIGRARTSTNPEMLVAKRTDDFEDRLKKALERVPRDGFQTKRQAAPILAANMDEQFAPDHLEEGSFGLDDKGQVRQRVNGKLVPTDVIRDKDGKISLTLNDRMKQLIGIRDATKGLMLSMRTLPDEPGANKAIAQLQAKLVKQIEAYRSRHGWFSERKTKEVFSEDHSSYPLLLSLEDYDKSQKTGTAADILSKRTIYPENKLTSLSTDPKEAFYQVLGERGRPDLEFMSGLSGKTVDEIAKPLVDRGLVFKEPGTGDWQTREKYLSGYVRDKLADAQKAVEQGKDEFKANVAALEKVQPETVPINSGDPNKDIQVKLGATWIDPKVITQFAKEVLKSGYYAKVEYAGGTWATSGLGSSAEMAEYGGGGMSAGALLDLALNLKQPVVKESYKDAEGNTREVVNVDKTIAAKRAQQKLKDEFAKWARNHKTIGPLLEKTYNEQINNLVEPTYDGSHLTFPGMNRSVLRGGQLQPHQSDVVWRTIQDGRALLAHVVGAGKTYEIIASAMELKRLGMIRKPMIAVPNHLVGQWSKDFLKLYPGAKILVPDKKDFEASRRNRIMAKIATGNWDAVILPHSQFNLMDISPERQTATLNKELDELEETYNAAKAQASASGDRKSFTVKRLEKARDRLRAKLAELKDMKADKTVRFDDLGVDHLFVDEAHAYKNLAFYTKMDRVSGLAQGDSKRAIRLKMKTDYLLEKYDNRGVVFATGTPIQNTMAEMYTMIKYVAPDMLQRAGIKYFDDWAANFGETITAMELGVDGRSYKPRSKFARFTNVPELQQMFRSFADVKTKEDLNLPVPTIEGGAPQPLTARPTPELEDYVKQLIVRAQRCRGEGGPRPDPKEDNMLKVTGDGRKAATDLRLIDPNYPDDPDSKINTVVNKAFEEWESGKADRLTQAIFLDNYQYLEEVGAITNADGKVTKKGKETALLNLYKDMADKLVAKGVPKSDIAIIHDYDKQEQKTELFRQMNAGEKRILFGSTEKMGAGMNAQERMKSLIDVDSPWRPGDLEQRHGRILRQGNMNKSVRIYHAVTKGTFDSYMIQTLKGKAEFINQVMSGKFKGRTMVDAAGDMVLSLEEMLAASSNNPDVKKKMELEAEVATLRALEREHEANMYRNKRNAEGERDTAARKETEAAIWKKIKGDWDKATEGDKFSLDILGKKFTEYKEAADWIKDETAPPMPFHFQLNGVPIRFDTRQSLIQGEPVVMKYTVGSATRELDNFPMLLASSYGYLNPKNVESRIRTADLQAQESTEKAEKLEKLAQKSGFEDADRLKAAANELEAVKKRLGLSDDQSAKEQDVAAEVDSTPEPAEEPEDEGIVKRLLKEETGSFDPKVVGNVANQFYSQDVAPALKKSGIGVKETAGLFVKALYPRIEESSFVGRRLGVAAPTDAVDALMKLKGERAKAMAEFDGIMNGMEKMFDHFSEDRRIDFIDRMQTGQEQPYPELQEIADAIKKIQDLEREQEQAAINLGRRGQMIELAKKENYFNNRWATPPGRQAEEKEDERIGRMFTPRRPLEGSKGYNKRQSYTLKSGIEAGGKPVTTNPIRLLRMRLEDGMKFVTARRAWEELHNLDLRQYVKKGAPAPEGFTKIDDKIAKVYFPATIEFPGAKEPVTAPHELGEWYVEANTARLLNNMLSRDRIRENAAGRGLMWLKNASTALELGLSPFHAVFETIEAASSQLALGMLRSYNLGIREGDAHQFTTGLREMLSAPVAPISMAREGAALPAYIEARARLEKIGISEFGHKQIEGKQPHGVMESLSHFREVRKQAGIQRLLKTYPDLDQLIDDMFTGGLIIGQHADYQTKMLGKTMMESWSAGNPIGALVRAVPTMTQGVMKPLFQWYIPNLKYSLFLRQMSEQAAENTKAIEDGSMTRAELARRVADSVENRFGELNFDNLFWNRTFKTAMQFIFRSVTWKLGTGREGLGAISGQAKELGAWAWQAHALLGDSKTPTEEGPKPGALPKLDMKASWLVALMATTVGLGMIAAKILSKKYPWEWAKEEHAEEGDAAFVHALYLETIHPRTGEMDFRDKPVRISLPTYWKDVEGATSNPTKYVVGSLSTMLGKGIDLAHNTDYFGNYIYPPGERATLGTKLKDAAKYMVPVPFTVSSFQRNKSAAGSTTAVLGAFGFPKAPSNLDWTPAERLANDLKRKEPHTQEEIAEWQAKREALDRGEMTAKEARAYVREQRLTWLERQVKTLSYGQALDVLDKANDVEKTLLTPIIQKKRANLLKQHKSAQVQEAEEAAQ